MIRRLTVIGDQTSRIASRDGDSGKRAHDGQSGDRLSRLAVIAGAEGGTNSAVRDQK
jgi:hypothetical protein